MASLLKFNSLLLTWQDAKIEPEEFTSRLQTELKSSPQPYLVPFLKVRFLLVNFFFLTFFLSYIIHKTDSYTD